MPWDPQQYLKFAGQRLRPAAPVIHFGTGTAGLLELMKAAGILRTEQHLVVMPDDPALGEFQKDFAGLVGQLYEFPGAKKGDWMLAMRQRVRRTTSQAGRRVSTAMKDLTTDERDPEEAKLDRLERLGELKEKGVLTATEFREEKKKVLTG